MTKETAATTPPVVVSGLALFGYSLQEWVYVLTICYLILQIALIANRVFHTFISKRNPTKKRSKSG